MKRVWMVIAMLAIVAVVAVFGVVSVVNAQAVTPPAPGTPGQGYGPMGRGGMMGGAYGTGLLHDYMEPALADKLGVSVEELEAAHADGKTFWQVAEEKGFTVEEAQQLMIDARTTALDAAAADGVITAEQAEWMKTRMSSGRMGQGYGAGGCGMGGYNGTTGTTGTPRGRMGGRW